MEFIETPTYKREADRILGEEDVLSIEDALLDNPLRGEAIPGGNGLRKFRMKYRGQGARNGLRIIHYFFQEDTIILTALYSKSEKSDLTKSELKKAVKETKAAESENKREHGHENPRRDADSGH